VQQPTTESIDLNAYNAIREEGRPRGNRKSALHAERTLVQGKEKMIKYVRALKVRKACLNVFHLSSQDA
jgi:hypothetical protein